MKTAGLVLLALVVLGAALMVWQHLRYAALRRHPVQDHQALLHGGQVFHSITWLRVEEGGDAVDALRALRRQLGKGEGPHWVYAGKVAVNALDSAQLGARDWSAVAVLQHPSREAFDRTFASPAWREALAPFADHYTHGMHRSALVNLMLPQALLALRVGQVLTRAESGYPFEPAAASERELDAEGRVARLREEKELGREAIVIVNLIRHGTPEQQAADRAYGLKMLALMAELAYGPMHMGKAVTVEGDARFDRAALVFYPGVDFFASLATSRYFQGIVGDKQLADTQATITVPILDRL